MPGDNAESRARKAAEMKAPKDGQEMQQVQALQSSIQEIQGEQRNNLTAARMGAEGDARENQAMLQAAELGMIGGGAVAAENITQVQQTSPQTQAILGKYGVGKPRHQTQTTRSVQQTPTKITINNNTTNNTTNNVAVPPANTGGPVQGRTVAVKQQPDQGQARFKTWISNAFARQNQAAAQREKEYQRREWSLSRTTGKLMKKLQELGTNISEKMDPRRMASSVGGHLKTLLFLFGTAFLASNWKKVLKSVANIESFFLGTKGEDGTRGRSGFTKAIIGALGGDPSNEKEGIIDSLRKLFWTKDGENGGVGVFNIFLKKITDWFEEGALAAEKIQMPKDLINKEPIEAIQDLINYLSGILTSIFTGGKGLKKSLENQINKASDSGLRGRDNSWDKYGEKNEENYHKKFDESSLRRGGIKNEDVISAGVNLGDAVEGWHNGRYSAHLFSNDLTKEGNLTGTASSVHRQVASIEAMVTDKKKLNIASFNAGMKNLDTYMKSEKGQSSGMVLPSGESLKNLGVSQSTIDDLRKSGHLKKKKFVQVVDEKTLEERREESKHATSKEKEAAKSYVNNLIKNKVGLRKMKWKVAGAAAGAIAGGILLTPVTGGGSLLVTANVLTGLGLGAALGGGAHDLIMDEKVLATLRYLAANDELSYISPYTIRLVPEDEVNGREIYKGGPVWQFEKEVLDNEGWNTVKNEIGLGDASFDLFDENYRNKVIGAYKTAAISRGNTNVASLDKYDYGDIDWDSMTELDEMKAQHQQELSDMWQNSRLKKGADYVSSSAKDFIGQFKAGKLTHSQRISKEQSEENTKKTLDFFTSKGLTPEQASGIAGVFYHESDGINPARINEQEAEKYSERSEKLGYGIYGQGIAQWSNERNKEFADWHKKKYGEWVTPENANLDSQLEFAWHEMNQRPKFIEALRDSATVEEATDAVIRGYENGGINGLATPGEINKVKGYKETGNSYEKMMAQRVPKGLAIFEKYYSGMSGSQGSDDTLLAQDTTQESTVTPSNYVEAVPSDSYKDDWSWSSLNTTPSWNWGSSSSSGALEMAKSSINTIEPDSSTLITSSTPGTSISGGTTYTASSISTNNDSTNILAEISGKIDKIYNATMVIPQGQLAQIEGLNNLSQSLANVQIMAGGDSSGPKASSVQSFTSSPYLG